MPQNDEAASWTKLLGVSPDAGALKVCQAFEKLAVVLTPIDLKGLPVYAMPISSLPPKFATASRHVWGWFDDVAYYQLQPYLPDDRGPGPTIFVKDVRSEQEAEGVVRDAQAVCAAEGEHVEIEELRTFLQPLDSVEHICRVLLHELAHAIVSLADGEWQMWNEAIDGRQSRIEKVVKRFDRSVLRKQAQVTAPPPQLHCHNLRFSRIIVHLDYRLRSAGVHAKMIGTAGDQYNQCSYFDCYSALGTEPVGCRRKSFNDILALPMPPAFEKCDLDKMVLQNIGA